MLFLGINYLDIHVFFKQLFPWTSYWTSSMAAPLGRGYNFTKSTKVIAEPLRAAQWDRHAETWSISRNVPIKKLRQTTLKLGFCI